MGSDDFRALAGVLRASRIARAALGVGAVLVTAADRSIAARVARRARRGVAEAPAFERVQLAGILLLTATLTHGFLLPMVPALVRPAAPRLLRVVVAVVAIVLVVAASSLVRAWPRSRLQRFVAMFQADASCRLPAARAPDRGRTDTR